MLEPFDGRNWIARKPALQQAETAQDLNEVHAIGSPLSYQMTLEPTRLSIVPVLEGTLALQADTLGMGAPVRQGGCNGPRQGRLANARNGPHGHGPEFQSGPKLPSPELADLLQLPPGVNTQTFSGQGPAPSHGRVHRSQGPVSRSPKHIATQATPYTLTPGDMPTNDRGEVERNLIDRFWIDRKSGFASTSPPPTWWSCAPWACRLGW